MDDLARSWRILLIAAAIACGPRTHLAPVGVSRGGQGDHGSAEELDAATPMLVGLPRDFRATWKKTGTRIVSEHDRFVADVYADHSAYIEDLFASDAGAGVYLIERSDAGLRFAVADVHGAALADSALDAGASVEACVRCHANARDGIYPIFP